MSQCTVEIKSVQTSNLRTLFEVLKDVLVDFNLLITKSGMKVTTMGSKNIAMVHLRLHADRFEYFHCERPCILGMNAQNFFKIMKNITSMDAVSLIVERDDETKLVVKVDNTDRNTQCTYKYNLMDLHYEEMSIPPQTFDSEISFPSDQFNSICKMLNNLQADELEITSYGQELILKGDGLISSAELRLGSSDTTVFLSHAKDDRVVTGRYPLDYLLQFSKAAGLSKTMQLYLLNDYPLVMAYAVGNLGVLKFLLANNVDGD